MSDPRHRRYGAAGYLLGIAGSLVLHGAVVWLAVRAHDLPSFDDVHFRRPVEITLGVTAPAVEEPPPPPPPPPPKPRKPASPPKPPPREPPEQEASPGRHAPPREDPTTEAPPPVVAPPAQPEDLVMDDDRPFTGYAPPGAQIALRLDVARVRASPLAGEVGALLAAIPDWGAVIGGSGIDPLADLDGLYVATPDLRRASVVIAGSYSGDEELPRRAVRCLALSSGEPAEWRTQDGFAVAPWHDRDETRRVVALVGPREFVISRDEDVARVLAVARALAERDAAAAEPEPGAAGGATPPELAAQSAAAPAAAAVPADSVQASLLTMPESQILSLAVEGVRHFVEGKDARIPERLQIALGPGAEDGILLEAKAYYEDARAASLAAKMWRLDIALLARHSMALLLGLRPALEGTTVSAPDDTVEVRATVGLAQARVLLGTLRDLVRQYPPPEAGSSAAPEPSPLSDGCPPRASSASGPAVP